MKQLHFFLLALESKCLIAVFVFVLLLLIITIWLVPKPSVAFLSCRKWLFVVNTLVLSPLSLSVSNPLFFFFFFPSSSCPSRSELWRTELERFIVNGWNTMIVSLCLVCTFQSSCQIKNSVFTYGGFSIPSKVLVWNNYNELTYREWHLLGWHLVYLSLYVGKCVRIVLWLQNNYWVFVWFSLLSVPMKNGPIYNIIS